MKTAIITGITGQDGSYLAEFLIAKGYKVVGIVRRVSTENTQRINHLKGKPNLELVEGDITDPHDINSWLSNFKPDEFYNLAAQSHVQTSFTQPIATWKTNAESVLHTLEAIKNLSKDTRFYQASTSEMFGANFSSSIIDLDSFKTLRYQDEKTAFAPQSPYAVSKVAAHNMTQLYRGAYGLFAASGILFNHESERRCDQFVTRKITKWIGEYWAWWKAECNLFDDGQIADQDDKNNLYIQYTDPVGFPKLRLGYLDAYRDWGYAPDYVEAMWKILQHKEPDDFVIATGETHSVREFLDEAFGCMGITDWKDFVVLDDKFVRPAEVKYLMGQPQKAGEILNWHPRVKFKELVQRMVKHDIQEAIKKGLS